MGSSGPLKCCSSSVWGEGSEEPYSTMGEWSANLETTKCVRDSGSTTILVTDVYAGNCQVTEVYAGVCQVKEVYAVDNQMAEVYDGNCQVKEVYTGDCQVKEVCAGDCQVADVYDGTLESMQIRARQTRSQSCGQKVSHAVKDPCSQEAMQTGSQPFRQEAMQTRSYADGKPCSQEAMQTGSQPWRLEVGQEVKKSVILSYNDTLRIFNIGILKYLISVYISPEPASNKQQFISILKNCFKLFQKEFF
jgi:hypothetical protein